MADWMSKPEWGHFGCLHQIDFEFRQDVNHHSVPVCMHVTEMRSGIEMPFWENQLRAMRRAPFGIGDREVTWAFSSTAELGCFLSLGWPFPQNLIDPFIEHNALINGRHDVWPPINKLTGKPEDTERRPGLLDSLKIHGLDGMSKAEKDRMRDVILGDDYRAHRAEIQDYNKVDVDETIDLTHVIAPHIDVPRALHHGRFMKAVAHEERLGIPVDMKALKRLSDNWVNLQFHYIAKDDVYGLYDGTSFREGRLEDLIAEKGWQWTRTPSGRRQQSAKVFVQQARRYSDPGLRRLAHLRNMIAELRISKLVDSVGADGFARISMLPFWTRTSRCQPSSREKVFLFSLPGWLHGLVSPPAGYSVAHLDWDAQEIGVMAGLSGDTRMIGDFRSGDFHWQFGVGAGLIPADGDKGDEALQEVRQKSCKPITLGVLFGMTPFGIAASAKRSLIWAQDMHARHRAIYPTFHKWLGDTIVQARFDGQLESPLGWPLAVIAGTRTRTLQNYMAQSGGADAMRLTTIAAVEAGISVCASVHDAFWIMARTSEIDDTIAAMANIMERAGAAVSGLPIPTTLKDVVHGPMNLGEVRRAKAAARGASPGIWEEVWALIEGWEAGGCR